MRRKHALILGGLTTCLTAVVAGLYALVTHQPAFYRDALKSDVSHAERQKLAKEFVQAAVGLRNEVISEERWMQEFSEGGANAWLAEDLPAQYSEWLPPGVSNPRVQFDKDQLQFAFHTRRGLWSGVISGRVRVWVSGPNELAFEIQSLNAGLIPIPVDDAVGDFVNEMNAAGWRLEWRPSKGGDALVLSLDQSGTDDVASDHPVVESLELLPGRLKVFGGRREEVASRADR